MLLLHYTGMSSGDAALARLCDPASEVSCHYLVWEDGAVDQLVPEARRAWHAGRGSWRGDTDINSLSIGIEIVNAGHDGGCPPYPDVQIDAVIALGRDICARHAIPASRVLGHSDVAPLRKEDPGEHFPWQRLAAAGLGLWPRQLSAISAAADGSIASAQARLAAIGYACPTSGVLCPDTRAVVRAFQRHWRPASVTGELDEETQALFGFVAEASKP